MGISLNSTIPLCLFLIFCQQSFAPEPDLIKALTDDSISIRGTLVEIDEQTFRLDYYDVYEEDSHYEMLSAKGYQGGGPSWLGIIYGAIQLSDKTLLDNIRFDDEAEGLAIWSADNLVLQQIGRLIAVVKSDDELMNKCIEVAEKNWQME